METLKSIQINNRQANITIQWNINEKFNTKLFNTLNVNVVIQNKLFEVILTRKVINEDVTIRTILNECTVSTFWPV